MQTNGNHKEYNNEFLESKTKLEKLLNISMIFIAYIFFYLYLNLFNFKVEFIGFSTLIQMPIITVIAYPLIHYVLIESDTLQRSNNRKNKYAVFFQNQYPSKYILEKCQTCNKSVDCKNKINEKSYRHVKLWFDVFLDGIIKKNDPNSVKKTYKCSYTCKLVYYLSRVFLISSIASTIIMISYYTITYKLYNTVVIGELISLQILFPIATMLIFVLLINLNKLDNENPSGCWESWREINYLHRIVIDQHMTVFKKNLCDTK